MVCGLECFLVELRKSEFAAAEAKRYKALELIPTELHFYVMKHAECALGDNYPSIMPRTAAYSILLADQIAATYRLLQEDGFIKKEGED